MERHKGEIYRVKKRGGRRKMKGGGRREGRKKGIMGRSKSYFFFL